MEETEEDSVVSGRVIRAYSMAVPVARGALEVGMQVDGFPPGAVNEGGSAGDWEVLSNTSKQVLPPLCVRQVSGQSTTPETGRWSLSSVRAQLDRESQLLAIKELEWNREFVARKHELLEQMKALQSRSGRNVQSNQTSSVRQQNSAAEKNVADVGCPDEELSGEKVKKVDDELASPAIEDLADVGVSNSILAFRGHAITSPIVRECVFPGVEIGASELDVGAQSTFSPISGGGINVSQEAEVEGEDFASPAVRDNVLPEANVGVAVNLSVREHSTLSYVAREEVNGTSELGGGADGSFLSRITREVDSLDVEVCVADDAGARVHSVSTFNAGRTSTAALNVEKASTVEEDAVERMTDDESTERVPKEGNLRKYVSKPYDVWQTNDNREQWEISMNMNSKLQRAFIRQTRPRTQEAGAGLQMGGERHEMHSVASPEEGFKASLVDVGRAYVDGDVNCSRSNRVELSGRSTASNYRARRLARTKERDDQEAELTERDAELQSLQQVRLVFNGSPQQEDKNTDEVSVGSPLGVVLDPDDGLHFEKVQKGDVEMENEAIQIAEKVLKIHLSGSSTSYDWSRVVSEWSSEKTTKRMIDENQSESSLDVQWNPGADVLMFVVDMLDEKRVKVEGVTDMSEGETVHKLYDLARLVPVCLVYCSVQVKESWLVDVKWHDIMSSEVFDRGRQWGAVLWMMRDVKIIHRYACTYLCATDQKAVEVNHLEIGSFGLEEVLGDVKIIAVEVAKTRRFRDMMIETYLENSTL